MTDEQIPDHPVSESSAPPSAAPPPSRPTPSVAVGILTWIFIEIQRIGFALLVGLIALGGMFLYGGLAPSTLVISTLVIVYLAHSFSRYVIHDPVPAAQAGSAAHPDPNAPPIDSTREVVETIVFVVVLVLLLKSFVAEAFVIPTGSMAETLYGYQKIVTCPSCGFVFPVNCSCEVDPSEGQPRPVFACTCPNCMQQIHFPNAPAFYRERHPESRELPDPGDNSGDRVLVSKFQYDLFDRRPDRLDVVVFKYPGDEYFPRSGPQKNYVPMNYIKRLVGLSGETIAIHAGDLYRLPPDQSPKYDDLAGVLPERRKSFEQLLWRKRPNMHENDAREQFRLGKFEILRKPPAQILSMRRIVYDHDFPPTDTQGREFPRWAGTPTWMAGQQHDFLAAPPAQDPGLHWLRYRNILRGHGGKPQLITDFMGYNTWDDQRQHHGHPNADNWVGDLILDCEAIIDKPEGQLVLELVKSVDRFQARFDLAAGKCTLVARSNGTEKELASQPCGVRGGTYRLRFANVDERLTLWVNDSLVFGEGVDYSASDVADPNNLNHRLQGMPTPADLEPVGIGTRGASVVVKHLQVWRDTYYTVDPSGGDVPGLSLSDPAAWVEPRPWPVKTLYVQPDHYLCLGDNSLESSDGRSWGLVPDRLLLGRALLVYYPLNRAGRIR